MNTLRQLQKSLAETAFLSHSSPVLASGIINFWGLEGGKSRSSPIWVEFTKGSVKWADQIPKLSLGKTLEVTRPWWAPPSLLVSHGCCGEWLGWAPGEQTRMFAGLWEGVSRCKSSHPQGDVCVVLSACHLQGMEGQVSLWLLVSLQQLHRGSRWLQLLPLLDLSSPHS